METSGTSKHVAVSGGFDPLHIGHVRMFEEAKKLGDELTVILNCNDWLMRKKGFVFMDEEERAEIIAAMECVDHVYVLHSDRADITDGLRVLKPNIFANGGDRKNEADIPEAKVCEEMGIEMVFNVGGGKVQSSSLLTNKIKSHE